MIFINNGKILLVDGLIAAHERCCCGCCSCSEFDPIATTGGSGSLNNLTIDLSLSDYDFCTENSFIITMRIRNTTAFTVGETILGHQPQIVIGNRVKLSPTDIIDPGDYTVTATTPMAFSTVYEPLAGSQPCPGNRVVVTYGFEVFTPGFDKTYTASIDVLSTRIQGNSPGTAAGIHGHVVSTSFGQRYSTFSELSSVLCGQQCCELHLCIDGSSKPVSTSESPSPWDVSNCCDCVDASLLISMDCVDGEVSLPWTYECGEITESGVITVTGACSEEFEPFTTAINAGGCSIDIGISNEVNICLACPESPCDCCWGLVPWTTGECDTSEVPDFVDNVGLTDVSVSNDPFCDGQSTVVTLTFTNNSGGDYGGGPDPIRFDLTSTSLDLPTGTSSSAGGTITPNVDGFSVEWPAPGSWPNGTDIVKTVTIQNNGCTAGVSQIFTQVYAGRGYICSISWNAVACP